MGGGRMRLVAVVAIATAAYHCCLADSDYDQDEPACAPGCEAISAPRSSSLLLLDAGSCYFINFTTPLLAVSGPAAAANNSTWSPSPLAAWPLPVLDLCNRVQGIWLAQGACGGENGCPCGTLLDAGGWYTRECMQGNRASAGHLPLPCYATSLSSFIVGSVY